MSQRKRDRRPERPAPRRRAQRSQQSTLERDPHLVFGPVQGVVLAVGVVVAIAAFWVLSTGSITAAPLLLMLGYLVLIPLGLSLSGLRRKPGSDNGRSDEA